MQAQTVIVVGRGAEGSALGSAAEPVEMAEWIVGSL
jgi:hypothetical protein